MEEGPARTITLFTGEAEVFPSTDPAESKLLDPLAMMLDPDDLKFELLPLELLLELLLRLAVAAAIAAATFRGETIIGARTEEVDELDVVV